MGLLRKLLDWAFGPRSVPRKENSSIVKKHIATQNDSSPEISQESSYQRRRAVGDRFEAEIMQRLDSICERYGGEAYRGIVIPYSGTTTEIDIVVALSQHIFVIECKNWAGTVYANYDQHDNWVRVRRDGVSDKFYSPVRQNDNHMRALSEYLGIKSSSIISAIVFPDGTILKKLPPVEPQRFIGHVSELCQYFYGYGTSHHSTLPGLSMCKMRLEQAARRSEYNEAVHHRYMNQWNTQS